MRRSVARWALRNTSYARGFASSVGEFAPVPELEDDSPAGAAARAFAGEYLGRHARAEFNIPGITFGSRYDGSPAIAADGSAPPIDAANAYTPDRLSRRSCAARPGWAMGPPLFDRFGFEFTLLVMRNDAEVSAPAGVPLTVLRLPELRDLYEADLALIRPRPDRRLARRPP